MDFFTIVSSNFFTSFYVFGLKLILGRNSIYLEGKGVYKYNQLGKAKNKNVPICGHVFHMKGISYLLICIQSVLVA